jgi:hypothetical protein
VTRDFLQGLIKISAAFIKWQSRTPPGVEFHYQGALTHLRKVADQNPIYMGMDLTEHLEKVRTCFGQVFSRAVGQWPEPGRDYPYILLRF